jgi:hypothetical protein
LHKRSANRYSKKSWADLTFYDRWVSVVSSFEKKGFYGTFLDDAAILINKTERKIEVV